MWGCALYVFSPGTDGKNFELAPPGLCGEIDSAMAGAESRPPEREKHRGEARPPKARIFSPSVVGSGRVVFCKPYRSKSVFAYVIGYGREKQRARLVFFWRSHLLVRARPPSSQIGPKRSATGKESTRARSFSRPCWRTLFLLLLWRYVMVKVEKKLFNRSSIKK